MSDRTSPASGQLLDSSILTDRAVELVEAARRAGADSADAVVVRSASLSVEVREGKVEESERSEGDDLGLRVFIGRRQAIVSTNDVLRSDPRALAERAVAMARMAPEDQYAGLADPSRLAREFPDLDLVDPHVPDAAHLEKLAKEAEAAGLAIAGVTKSGGASASAGLGGMVLATSDGFVGSYVGSRHGLSMTAIAGEGTAMERDYEFSSALHASDLEAPHRVGAIAGERAVARLSPRKVATIKCPVVYAPRVAGSLIGHLSSAINGAAIARKTSFLKDRLGQQILSAGLRVIDDPLRPRGLRSHPFDGEGVAVRRQVLVEDGVLQSWILDSASARELGLETTGHGARGVSSPPSPSATNLYLEAGDVTPDDLIADIAQGFYVTDLIGSGASIVTGDYSRGAAGFWIEHGKIAYPVSEVTIAGHMREMFTHLTPASDLTFRYGINAPTLRIEDMTVAGR